MSTLTDAQRAQQASAALQMRLRELQNKHATAAAGGAQAAAAPVTAADSAATPPPITYPLKRRWLPVTGAAAASSPSVSNAAASAATAPAAAAQTIPAGVPLKLLSYNILAQSLVRRDMFPYSSRSSLKVGFRKDNLLAELLAADADILALQEVDADLVHSYWGVKLAQAGYKYEFGARNREGAKHGCALFYRKSKFEKFASELVQFADELGAPYQHLPDNAPEVEIAQRKASVFEEMSRPNVAMLLGLRLKQQPSDASAHAEPLGLYVTNTHLFWDPRYRFVRLKQCQTLLDRLAALQSSQQTHYPSVLMGDFNVTPDNIIYHYLTDRNELERNEEHWDKFLTPAEHGMMRGGAGGGGEESVPVPVEEAKKNSGISTSSLSRLMQAVSLDSASQSSSSSSSAAAAAASGTAPVRSPSPSPRPPSPPLSNAPIHQLRTELVTLADGSVKVRDVEPEVDDSTPSSVLRLKEVKATLHHSKQLPLLKSLYASYSDFIPDAAARASLARSRAAQYCRWTTEAPFTNYTDKFKGTLDYIFVPTPNPASDPSTLSKAGKVKVDDGEDEATAASERSWADILAHPSCFVHPTHVLEIPPEEKVNTDTALPNDTISSDHVCIGARIVVSYTPPTAQPAHAAAASPHSDASPPSALARSIAASLAPPAAFATPAAAAAGKEAAAAAAAAAAATSFPPFSPATFRSLVRSKHVGHTLHYLPTVGSTMDVCKEALFGADGAAKPSSGTIWLADEQTKGRGRIEGRTWASPSCANIYMTLLLQLPVRDGMEALRKMNQSVCLAVAQAIEASMAAATGLPPAELPQQLRPRIKWPNDVWIAGKKCCGMLIDVEHCGSEMNVVIGVGINVFEDMRNHPDAALRESATSVAQALREWQQRQPSSASASAAAGLIPLSRERLLASFASSLESLAPLDFSSVLSLYSRFDMLLGQRIVVMPRKREHAESFYEALATGYSPDGYLVVRTDDGQTKELVAEEVTIRPTTTTSNAAAAAGAAAAK